MIVSILYSSPTFEAVDYNERKVANGVASLLVAENMGYLEEGQQHSANQLRQQLIDYSSQNERITKPQMHVAFSCRGDEMNNDELVDFARKWLKEMGYADLKQPLLIYSHNDTDNNHIHVITSRVDPQGRKINHNHERVRSKAFVEKTLGVDTRAELNKAVRDSLEYRFSSIGEWRAIMEARGYDVKQEGEVMKIARNGAYQATFPLSTILDNAASKEEKIDKKHRNRLKAWLLKYRDLSCCKEELQKAMKREFGVDLVFLGGKDNPRGYFIIDNRLKQVVKGSAVVKLSTLLQFETPEEKLKRMEAFVDAQLEANPQLTPHELNCNLKEFYGGWYKEGVVHYKGIEYVLPEYMREALKYNFKVAKVSRFAFADEQAKEALCEFFKIKSEDVSNKRMGDFTETQQSFLEEHRDFISKMGEDDDKLNYIKFQGQVYAIDTHNMVIAAHNYHREMVQDMGDNNNKDKESKKEEAAMHVHNVLPRNKRGKSSGSGANREWEVGKPGYDEYDDARRLKR